MNKRPFLLLCFIACAIIPSFACTSAIIGAKANPSGRPLLWKNRDTSTIDNKVEYVPGKTAIILMWPFSMPPTKTLKKHGWE